MELRQTVKAVTPLGGLVVFVDFLRKVRESFVCHFVPTSSSGLNLVERRFR
jgi:hypothetical protein